MSYILDALSRAEQERHLGEVPQLNQGLEGALPASGNRWLLPVLAVMVLISLLAIAAWLYERGVLGIGPAAQPAHPAVVEGPQPTPTPEAGSGAEPPSVVNTDVIESSKPEPVQAEPAPQATPTVSSVKEPAPATAVSTTPAAAPTEAEPPAASPTQAPVKKARIPTPSVAPAPPPNWVNEARRERIHASRENTAVPTQSYLGLPDSVRNSMPPLKMIAHVFSTNPERSFVMINNKRYRIGDELNEGPVVVDILPDGTVLDYRGEVFLLPVEH